MIQRADFTQIGPFFLTSDSQSFLKLLMECSLYSILYDPEPRTESFHTMGEAVREYGDYRARLFVSKQCAHAHTPSPIAPHVHLQCISQEGYIEDWDTFPGNPSTLQVFFQA